MSKLEKNVNLFLEEVGVDSEEHKKYLEKLNRVLNEMKNSSSSEERKHYFSFKATIESFDNYLTARNIKLTSAEKDKFSVIAVSGLNNLAKKRMAEDLVHQVKERVACDIEARAEDKKKREDIGRLKKSGFWLTDWVRLVKFAFDFGTITPFSHRLRSETLDSIRLTASMAYNEISDDIKSILDNYYFYLSMVEYNSLVKLHEIGGVLEKFYLIKKSSSYHPMEIFEEMHDFTSLFIYVMRNVKAIDQGLKKILKEKQVKHGFMGNIGLLTDRHLFESKSVKHTGIDRMTKTISGALFSYYTAYYGVRVNTFNQLMYITGIEGVLDINEKHYTADALKNMERETSEHEAGESKIKSRMSELVNISSKYSDMGKILSRRLFEIEAKGSIQVWLREAQTKPFFKLIRVFDSYLKYLVEFVLARESFGLEYDNRVIMGYFDNFPELIRAAEDFRALSLELQGARGKDLQNFKPAGDVSNDEFINRLMEHENMQTLPGEVRLIRETLNLISARSYNLCMKFNGIVSRYHQMERVESREITENYNFLINARIVHPRVRGLETLLGKKEAFLNDLLEAGCSLAEYFAETLKNSGIKAINDEVTKLRRELENLKSRPGVEIGESGIDLMAQGEAGLNLEIDKIYNDTLTGFRKWEYFEDFIMPEVYDENGNYPGNSPRHVFCCELLNLIEINRISGNSTGDIVYRRFSEIVREEIRKGCSNSTILRKEGGLLVGYLNDINALEGVDILLNILLRIKEYSLDSGIESLPELIFSSSVFSERRGSNARRNIEIARNIMLQGYDGKTGHVAFLRNPEQILSEKDMDSRGRLREGLISVMR